MHSSLLLIPLLLIGGSFAASTQCIECNFIVNLIHDEWGTDKTLNECLGDLAAFLCETFQIEDNWVCTYIVSDFRDEALWVIKQVIVEPRQICGLLMDDCGSPIDPLTVNWTIPIPGNAPPFAPPQPVPSGKPTMRVLHLTDLHLDMFYTPGLEADCDTPQCCRPQDIPDEVSAFGQDITTAKPIKRPAGYWGMAGDCDAPYYLYINMLENIVKNNGKLDYIVVTGDLMSHDVWNYNNVSHMSFIQNITDNLKKYFPDIPILQVIGNHEGVPIDNVAPHYVPSQWNMDWLYDTMLKNWGDYIPGDQNATMHYRGCYMRKLFPGLRIIALNNVYGDANNIWLYVNQTDPDGTMSWLIEQLLDAEKAGDKVQIIAHINGGDWESLEGWDYNYYNVINRFANTISAQLYGHTHYEIFYMTYADMNDHTSTPTSVIHSAPSLTPYDHYFPAYRIYTIDGNYPGSSYSIIDWEEWFFNLTVNNANPTNPKWDQLYSSVLKEYGLSSAIPSEWHKFIERMKADDDLFHKFYVNMNRISEYDDYFRPCSDANCKNYWLCKTRSFHHSNGTLCPDLSNTAEKKKRKYSMTKAEMKRRIAAYKLKRRDSDNCPL